jgi:hypothetical protein
LNELDWRFGETADFIPGTLNEAGRPLYATTTHHRVIVNETPLIWLTTTEAGVCFAIAETATRPDVLGLCQRLNFHRGHHLWVDDDGIGHRFTDCDCVEEFGQDVCVHHPGAAATITGDTTVYLYGRPS